MTSRWLLGAILVVGAVLPLDAGSPLSLKVSPAVSFAPANLFLRMQVAANDDNRQLEIVAESVDFYRSSAVELDGAHAPRTAFFEFHSLPAGSYSVTATLYGADRGARARVHQEIEVISSAADR